MEQAWDSSLFVFNATVCGCMALFIGPTIPNPFSPGNGLPRFLNLNWRSTVFIHTWLTSFASWIT